MPIQPQYLHAHTTTIFTCPYNHNIYMLIQPQYLHAHRTTIFTCPYNHNTYMPIQPQYLHARTTTIFTCPYNHNIYMPIQPQYLHADTTTIFTFPYNHNILFSVLFRFSATFKVAFIIEFFYQMPRLLSPPPQFNHLKTKRRLLYLKTQSVPPSKHF